MLIKENQKIIQIFLSSDEKNNDIVRRQAETICDEYSAQGYSVVIYFSGSQNLFSATSRLLLYNRKKFAEKDHSHER